MPTQIDHVLVATRTLDRTVADYGRLGFTVVPGGTHVGGKTHNALVGFRDGTYLELIAPTNPDQPPDEATLRRFASEGLIQFALASDDIDREAHHLANRDLAVSAVAANGRDRPDGRRTDWRTITVVAPQGVALPFLISDVTPRDVRVPGGEQADHPNGADRTVGLTSVVADLAATADVYRHLLHDPGTPVETGVEGAGAAVRFAVGDHWLEVVEPAPGDNPLRAYLDAGGPRPFEVVLGAGGDPDGRGGRGRLLDATLAHGARLRLVG